MIIWWLLVINYGDDDNSGNLSGNISDYDY